MPGKSNRVVVHKQGEFTDLDIDDALLMTKEISEYQYEIYKSFAI